MEKIAYYLPQFHEHKNNNQFWGDKFTDWVTTSAGKPLFDGHEQPLRPGRLGYYDLKNNPEIMGEQFQIAKNMGLTGFSFYHYRFSQTERALDEPIKFIRSSNLDIRYMITWVNCDWTKSWIGQDNVVIHEQTYDYNDIAVFADELCDYFSDKRYITIGDRPIFQLHHPKFLISKKYLVLLRKAFIERGFNPYIVAPEPFFSTDFADMIDAVTAYPPGDLKYQSIFRHLKKKSNSLLRLIIRNKHFLKAKLFKFLNVVEYESFISAYNQMMISKTNKNENYIPNFLAGWDNSPRYGTNGTVLTNYHPSRLASTVDEYFNNVSKPDRTKIVFFKAWNEWAEGNVLEPCERFDEKAYYDLREVLKNLN